MLLQIILFPKIIKWACRNWKQIFSCSLTAVCLLGLQEYLFQNQTTSKWYKQQPLKWAAKVSDRSEKWGWHSTFRIYHDDSLHSLLALDSLQCFLYLSLQDKAQIKRLTAAVCLPPKLWDNAAGNKAAQGWLNSHCLYWFTQPNVCTLVPPFLHDLSSYFSSAFLSNLFLTTILELPSLFLPKPPAEDLQLQAAVCYNLGVNQKLSLKTDIEIMKKIGKRYIVGARCPSLLSNECQKQLQVREVKGKPMN